MVVGNCASYRFRRRLILIMMEQVQRNQVSAWVKSALAPNGCAADLNKKDLKSVKILASSIPVGDQINALIGEAQSMGWKHFARSDDGGVTYHHYFER
jgi:hypothetical protein